MTRILFLTAVLIAAFSVNAFAAYGGEGNENQNATETQAINCDVPIIFFLNWGNDDTTTNSLITFTPSEQEILDGTYTETITAPNSLDWASNRDGTKLTVGSSNWTAPGTGNSPRLEVYDNMYGVGSGDDLYHTLINHANIAAVTFDLIDAGNGADGLPYESKTVFFKADQVDYTVDPGTYSTTVTFTLNHTP
jgi:hypothetical protein